MRLAPFLFAALLAGEETRIPDPASLLKDVTEHQKRMEEIRENYTWTRTSQTEELDSHGNVRSSTSEKLECFYVNRHAVKRVIARNGVGLNAEEQRKEEDRVRKRVEFLVKTPLASRHAGELSLISQILAVVKVSNPKRVSFRGRPTLTFDFVGDPKASAHNLEQKAARDLTGAIWIDEADRQIARLEIVVHDTFRIGGGLLASFQKGTAIELDQTRVEDGLWMMSAMYQHLDGRVALLKTVRENVHLRDGEFHKFDVGVLQKVGAPHQGP